MRKKGSAARSISERELAEVADEYMFSLEENKKSKGRRQPLSKLPRHHPLVLQECVSDDETSEQLTPEEEAEETEAWAKPLSQLWQTDLQTLRLRRNSMRPWPSRPLTALSV